MARLSPQQAIVDFRSRFTGERARRELVAIANSKIAETAALNNRAVGRPVDHTLYVDGRRDATVESVKENGVILAVFGVHIAAIDFTRETLERLSPVDVSDRADDIKFRDNHLLMVNDAEVQPGAMIGVDDVVTFVNLLPYARKIEHGWSKRQAPDGVYEVASRIIKSRFGNIVDVRFGYGSFSGNRAEAGLRYPYITLGPKRRR